MFHEATIEDGQVTIPKAVRERLDLEQGETVLFRFDPDGSVRLVAVPADPMERLKAAQERAASYDLDAAELTERERRDWSR